MNIITIVKDKIVEVYAAARVIVQRYVYTVKFAKHPVSLIIKQMCNFTDEQLADFLATDQIGKQLGYN
ncbi:MAG: hypothetical protein M1538_02695 [Candidatus Marsarchaeota archaeon]|nr:hypothetical protein [Candidatus Marsarchaeota archaeon]